MSLIVTLVLAVGALSAILRTLNAAFSFAGHYRSDLSWIRLQAALLAWDTLLIAWTGNVALLFAGSGALLALIALGFSLTPLGHAERFLA